MNNIEHGIRTGQHAQKQQQAHLPGCVEACEEMENDKPVARLIIDSSRCSPVAEDVADLARAGVSFAFRHPERIEITRLTILSHWQDAASSALARQAAEDAVLHCDECGAPVGTCNCFDQTARERAAERDGDRRGDEEREL
jgi:hypothetical protein